jgi:hypothetical protein
MATAKKAVAKKAPAKKVAAKKAAPAKKAPAKKAAGGPGCFDGVSGIKPGGSGTKRKKG